MVRKNLIKATLITTVIATLLTATACGKKTTNNTTTDSTTAITTEAKSVAVNDTKTGLVTFDYTDADGNTYTLEGKAVADEKGDATIEVTDANGNKVTFTGKSTTTGGKLSVSDIAVKDAGTLVKADGSKIEVTTDAIVADASESTGENTSDIAASDDVKNEIETAKKEETAVKEEENKDIVSDNDKEDVVIADNSDNSSSDKKENNTPVSTPDVKEEEKNDTPAPAPTEKEEDNTPASTPEPEPTPSVPEETPTEDTNDNNDNSNNSGYDFATVEGPNGPMYAFDGSNYKQAGQDVNQGADVACPYELKVVTTRYFFSHDSYSNTQGYYYVGINAHGGECENSFDDLSYQMGHYNNTRKKVGTYSCGVVWFCGFDD